jgi:hypothetical protein
VVAETVKRTNLPSAKELELDVKSIAKLNKTNIEEKKLPKKLWPHTDRERETEGMKILVKKGIQYNKYKKERGTNKKSGRITVQKYFLQQEKK